MTETGFLREYRPKILVALILTFSSGIVDIVGYEGVYRFFTAHLTGTTVHLGNSLVTGKQGDILAAAVIVGAFFGGSIFGRGVIEVGSRKHFTRIASVTLAIEALMLVAVIYPRWNSSHEPYLSLLLLAAAMGLQTATLTGIGPLTVHTTFVTGMVNKIGQLVSHIAFRAYDLRKSSSENLRRDQAEEVQMALFLVGIWSCYLGGAAFGAWSFEYWRLHALFLAVGLLFIGLATDQFSPLSINEEKEQSER